jgi:GNAT superfamily N-acetyltransferase
MSNVTTSVHVCETWEQRVESEAHLVAVYRGLSENTLRHCGPIDLGKAIRVFLRDAQGAVVGGIDGLVFGGWVYIKLLWVDAALRGQGHGTRLLVRMEEEAVRLGCRNAYLDTYSFEARPFYEKSGYEVFGHARRVSARAPEALPAKAGGGGEPVSFCRPALCRGGARSMCGRGGIP